VRVSDHACFARAALPGGAVVHANDLLPIAYTEASLALMGDNVMRVQDRLQRPLLIENLSAYLSFADDDAMTETAFFTALCRRTGCGMLLDVNNIMVNALNAGVADPLGVCCAYVDALPAASIGEIHVAGYCETPDLVIDDHGSRVRPDVWAVCEHALRRLGPRPVLVEWDTDVPPLAVLLGEAAHAASLTPAAHADTTCR